MIFERVELLIANIAIIFHWPPQVYTDMSLSELIMWHNEAIIRNTPSDKD